MASDQNRDLFRAEHTADEADSMVCAAPPGRSGNLTLRARRETTLRQTWNVPRCVRVRAVKKSSSGAVAVKRIQEGCCLLLPFNVLLEETLYSHGKCAATGIAARKRVCYHHLRPATERRTVLQRLSKLGNEHDARRYEACRRNKDQHRDYEVVAQVHAA